MDNQSIYIALIDTCVQFVEVSFKSGSKEFNTNNTKVYTYKTDLVLNVGDAVVVETYDWYSVATVTKANVPIPLDSGITYRWVVDIVGTEGHVRRLNYERRVIEQVNGKRVNSMRNMMLAALGLNADDATHVIEHVHNEEKGDDNE